MIAVLWFLAIILCLVALVVTVSASVASARAGKWPLSLMCGAFALALLVVAVWGRNPLVLGGVSLLLAPLAFWITKRSSRSSAQAEQVTQLSAAHVTLLIGSLLFLIPFAWLISTSLKPDDEQAAFPPVWIPTQQITTDAVKTKDGDPAPVSWYLKGTPQQVKVAEYTDLPSGEVRVTPLATTGDRHAFDVERGQLDKIREVGPRWKNYQEALAFLPPETYYGLTFLGNTLILTILTVIGTLISSSMVAYAFARMTWPGKNLLFVVLLATMMIPGAVTMMPQFLIFRTLGWIDTLNPLWVPAFFGSAFNIFLLRQFFMSVPSELEDAAKIDGCSPFATYWKIMLPQVKPALAAVAITAVMGAWNNFQGPLIYLSSPDKMTLAYALQLYQQDHGGEPGLLMAASTLVVLPIIVLFFFTQRYFIEGVSLSGLGGR